jgi:hypothetical protein
VGVRIFLILLVLALPVAPPRCAIAAAQLSVDKDSADVGAIVLAQARVTVASPCVFRPVLRADGSIIIHQYADASSLGEALVEWPITVTAPGVYRVALEIDGVLYDTATLTVMGGTAEPHTVWLPLVAREAAHAVWLPLVAQ